MAASTGTVQVGSFGGARTAVEAGDGAAAFGSARGGGEVDAIGAAKGNPVFTVPQPYQRHAGAIGPTATFGAATITGVGVATGAGGAGLAIGGGGLPTPRSTVGFSLGVDAAAGATGGSEESGIGVSAVAGSALRAGLWPHAAPEAVNNPARAQARCCFRRATVHFLAPAACQRRPMGVCCCCAMRDRPAMPIVPMLLK